MTKIEHILYFLEKSFEATTFPDYPHALNGLQVEGRSEVEHVGAAVDASEETIAAAGSRGVHLLVVHHGLFWGGLGPITGPGFRKVSALIGAGVNLYGLHLPLDAHPEMGNNAILMRKLGLEPAGRFGSFKEMGVGWWASASMHREELLDRVRAAVGGEARLIPGGPEEVGRVAVLTGGGASALSEAAAVGLDTMITGEVPHHAYHEAMEMGLNLILGGHYATETFGVKAVAERLAEEFHLSWEFLHFPTGL
ncbi:MAG: Nif3-like dinuclear metal center hexameric protein [Longimicrobiales bacterium]|nr:Nif3-like dinuclear metal center hexameric protein [Longimicrobiales bacterium]